MSLVFVIVLAQSTSAVGSLSRPAAALSLLALLVHPYLLLRVIRHFRIVPRWWGWTLLGAAAGLTAVALFLPSPKPASLRLAIMLFIGLMQTAAALALASTAKVHRGLTAWRLNFAALGAAFFALIFVFLVLSGYNGTYRRFLEGLRIFRFLSLGMFVSYYLGLVPPRFVRRMLQRGVEYQFLRRVNEHNPDERARLVAIDLARAAARSTATASTLVLSGSGPMRIDGASDPAWRGTVIDPLDGAIGRVVTSRFVAHGDAADLEPALRAIAGSAERFLTVPIVGATRAWGVLLIIQRRRSLFPKDDLAILERLCRYTAEVFDHAQLIADERARQQREADDRLDLILESLQDYAVITVDDVGLITSWNAGAEQVFQYPAAEAVGQPVTRLFDDGAPWLAGQLQRVRAGDASPIPDSTGRRRDDSRLTTTVVIRPLQMRGRRPGGFVIVMRDVSQRRLLEDRLRQSQKLEAIGRLAGGVAHDFNNMLTVIQGYAESLNDAVALEHRANLTGILNAGARAAALTRQLLAFSRQQVLSPKVVTLRDVVAGVVPMLTPLLGAHIDVVEDVGLHVPSILADGAQLEQVLVNLAVNARDAMPNGGRLTIRVASVTLGAEEAATLTGRAGLHALLEVGDTGTGLSEDTKARMFEPFFTTKDVGRGTGLGLSMVYGTVQQINGAITCDSELGRGTRFRIYVPAHVED